MHKTFVVVFAIAATLAGIRPASAQATVPERGLFVTLRVGLEAVQQVGGLAELQFGQHLTPRTDFFGELTLLQDVVTRARVESAEAVATYLTPIQGQTVTATLEMPAFAATVGIRHFLSEPAMLRPYIVGQIGVARTTLQPTFLAGETDITENMEQYGVVLGSDLAGSNLAPVFGGGIGVTSGFNDWYFDASLRIMSVRVGSQSANVKVLAVGIGRRF